MTTKYGDFVPPVFNTISDPYNDASQKSDRDKGLAFIARACKTGKTNDACFDKAKILFEGEKHMDASRRKLLANAEKKKLMVSDAFKASSPMKLSTGEGDFQGTFGGRVPYIAGYADAPLKKGDIPEGKPNLFTSPGKKGSYGTIKTTLSELKGAGGMHGEYAYAADPYDCSQAKNGKTSKVSDTPFIPANPPKKGSYGWIKTNIGNKAHGTVGEFGYEPQGYQVREAEKQKVETPFVPPKAPKVGYNCTFTKYPLFAADPEHIRIQAQRAARTLEREKLAGANPWHPPCVPKLGATRSIVRMNV